MTWFAHLTWSQSGLVLGVFLLLCWAGYLAGSEFYWRGRSRLRKPHHSAKRNGTQAVPR